MCEDLQHIVSLTISELRKMRISLHANAGTKDEMMKSMSSMLMNEDSASSSIDACIVDTEVRREKRSADNDDTNIVS